MNGIIQAVIMDGDGSTITQDGILPDNLRQLIINNPQIKWIMATGRSMDLLRRLPIIEYLSPNVPHIVDGGSRLVNHDGSSVIDYFLTPAEINSFFTQLTYNDVEFLYYYLDETRSYLYSHDNLNYWRKRPQFINAQATDKLSEYHNWALNNLPCKIFIRVKQNIVLNNLNWYQNEHNIDVTAHGINKGNSCCKVLELLDLKPEQAAFIFNDKNDLPLVEHPKLSAITTIKVGNYLPNTKANYHVANPYDVAEILAKLLVRQNNN